MPLLLSNDPRKTLERRLTIDDTQRLRRHQTKEEK
jgi:hypothetical protein